MNESEEHIFKEVDSLDNEEKKKYRNHENGKMIGGIFFRRNKDTYPFDQLQDENLYHLVCERIMEIHFSAINDLEIHVCKGIVSVFGEVSSEEYKKIIEEIVLKTPGVQDMRNYLYISSM